MSSIVYDFRNMEDFAVKKPVYLSDFVSIRHKINELLKTRLVPDAAASLHPGLDLILPGTSSET
jgi:hypothetical protein